MIMLSNIIQGFIISGIVSLVAVILMCFGAKMIKLKREMTELLIPIIGTSIFYVLLFVLLFDFVKYFDVVNVFNINGTFVAVLILAIPLLIYLLCRKIGKKSTAAYKHWAFIGVMLLCTIISFIFLLNSNVQNSFNWGFFFSIFLVMFVLMIFNMIFYKITKEVSFAIRRKKQ